MHARALPKQTPCSYVAAGRSCLRNQLPRCPCLLARVADCPVPTSQWSDEEFTVNRLFTLLAPLATAGTPCAAAVPNMYAISDVIRRMRRACIRLGQHSAACDSCGGPVTHSTPLAALLHRAGLCAQVTARSRSGKAAAPRSAPPACSRCAHQHTQRHAAECLGRGDCTMQQQRPTPI